MKLEREMVMKFLIQTGVFALILLSASIQAQEMEKLGPPLNLEKRQPDVSMTVTSVNLGREESTIAAEADMQAYGHVYATYYFTYDQDRKGGEVHVQGRGATEGGIMSGEGQGYWELTGSTITMRFVAKISDGTINYDVVTFVPHTREMIHRVYVLK